MVEVTEVINECKLAVTSMFYRFLAFASAFYRFLAVTSGFCRFLAVCKDMTLDLYTVTSGFYRFLAVTSAFYRFLAVMKQLDIVVCPTAFVWDPNLDIWYKNTALYQPVMHDSGNLWFRFQFQASSKSLIPIPSKSGIIPESCITGTNEVVHYTFRDMNYCPVWFLVQFGQTDR